LPSVSDGAMTTLVGGLALPGALGSQSHVRRDTAPGYWRVHAADGNRKELSSSCSGRSRHGTTHRTASWPAGHPVTCRQPVDQPLLTVTPFQKATRPRISSAAALGSG
jgi:hypothetical protein